MNKYNFILLIMCALLSVQFSALAQPKGMMMGNDDEEEKIETPPPAPVSTPAPPPVTTPQTIDAPVSAPEPFNPSSISQPSNEGTGNIYGQQNSSNPSSNLNRGTSGTTTTGGSTTTGSGPNRNLPRGGDDIGGTDVQAPPNYEEGQFVKEPLVQDGIYEKLRVKEREVLKYDNIREADVLWSKRIWRVIDTREKMNLTFSYPDQPFVGILLDIINKSDKVKIFVDDDFTLEATAEEVMGRLGATETVEVYNPVTEEYETEVVSNEFNPELITKIRIKEDWVFDEEASQMVVRILALAPIMDVYDDNDNFRGEQAMFWVYYPSIRQDLARYEAYNQFNDAQRMTWEDLLEMRYFSSYIYQEGNVRDMRIKDYIANGVDQLIESENIKRKLFEYEHDLWSY